MFEGVLQPWHLIIILGIVLIIFGPGKLPELGGALGRGIREFKDSTNDKVDQGDSGSSNVAAAIEPAAPVERPVAKSAEVVEAARASDV